MTVRFEAHNPADGIYRPVGFFGSNQISRTPLGCLIDQFGAYQTEMATRGHKINNILATVDINKIQTQLINRQIRQLEPLNLGRQPALRSHARGLMSRFDMDRLDGIDVNKVLENNPAFYSQGYREEGDTVLDLGRQPALRSHARGLMSRFDMDRLDGIDVKKVLENNPAFYSQGYNEGRDTILDEGEKVVIDIGGGARETETVANQDFDPKIQINSAGKFKRVPMKKKITNFLRRLCCVTTTTEG